MNNQKEWNRMLVEDGRGALPLGAQSACAERHYAGAEYTVTDGPGPYNAERKVREFSDRTQNDMRDVIIAAHEDGQRAGYEEGYKAAADETRMPRAALDNLRQQLDAVALALAPRVLYIRRDEELEGLHAEVTMKLQAAVKAYEEQVVRIDQLSEANRILEARIVRQQDTIVSVQNIVLGNW